MQLSLRNVGAGATFDPDRTFWQLLFPLDGREFVERDGSTEELTYSAEFLAQIVANFNERQRLQMVHGMPPQPLVVSYHHAIERRAYMGEDVGADELERAGGIFALHSHDAEHALAVPGIPLGLWALTEWTWRASMAIEDRTLHVLSPAFVDDFKTLEMESALPGPSLLAVGLVDQPAIEGIGTAQDRLPWWTFTAPMARPQGEFSDVAQTMRRAAAAGEHAIERRAVWADTPPQIELRRSGAWLPFADAQTRSAPPTTDPVTPDEDIMPPENTETIEAVETRSADETTEAPAALDRDAVVEIVKAELRSFATETLPGAITEAVGVALRAASTVEDTTDTEETAEVPEPGDFVTRCEKAEEGRIQGIVLRHVEEGRLLRSNVSGALAQLRKGEAIGDMLGDYTDAAMRSGFTADTGDVAPKNDDAPAAAALMTEAELAAEALEAVGGVKHLAHAKSVELRKAHEAAGTRIVFKRTA